MMILIGVINSIYQVYLKKNEDNINATDVDVVTILYVIV